VTDQSPTPKPTTVTRDELYGLVWQTPMQRLASQYGLTGNGLAKICDRMNVPYPPRGYWAKREAGKAVKQTPLPAANADTPLQTLIRPSTPRPTPPSMSEELQQLYAAALKQASGVSVPKQLRNPHPIIAHWIEERHREQTTSWYDRSGPVFTDLERRRHRILHALFTQLEKHNFLIKSEPYGRVSIEIAGNRIEFTLAEHIRQVRRLLTPEEKRKNIYYQNQKWTQEHIETGNLIFRLKTPLEHGLVQKWLDEPDYPLEQQIIPIIATFLVAKPILDEQRRRAEEERRYWAEQERLRQQELNAQRREKNRWRRFVEMSKQWHDAETARQFLLKLESLPRSENPEPGGFAHDDWLTWARENLDNIDPLAKGVDAVWETLSKVGAYDYRD
jgi:hypothetical protein